MFIWKDYVHGKLISEFFLILTVIIDVVMHENVIKIKEIKNLCHVIEILILEYVTTKC